MNSYPVARTDLARTLMADKQRSPACPTLADRP